MDTAAALIALCTLAQTGPNLLVNPGFDTLDGNLPKGWQVYVQPQLGAEGVLDDEVYLSAPFSVKLHTPQPYEIEPANNWSQNVIEELGGKTIRVAGNIKSREVTEAGLWIMGFRKHPWRITCNKTTSEVAPLYGTREWTPVDMRVQVPDDTDFVVLRCFIKGRGTAWFDSISVRVTESEDDGESEEDSEKDPPLSATAAALRNGDPEMRQALLDAYRAMLDTNRALRETNQDLMERLEALRTQLADIKAELDALRAGAEAVSPGAPAPREPEELKAPPLVPGGCDWRRMLE